MSLVWPFRTKDPAQYRRIDEGWDLQGLGPGEEDVLAVASGRIEWAHDPTDPRHPGAHFGDPYPVLLLDAPLDTQSVAVYYGHTHPILTPGAHVAQGEVIAHTTSPGGGLASDHWLEIGWWGGNGPIGNGSKMQWYLVRAPVFDGSTPAPTPPPPPAVTTIEGDPDMASIVNLPVHLDGAGNGYDDLDGQAGRPQVPIGRVLSLYVNAADPQVNKRYSPIPALAADDFEGHARVVVEGGPADGTVLVHVGVAG